MLQTQIMLRKQSKKVMQVLHLSITSHMDHAPGFMPVYFTGLLQLASYLNRQCYENKPAPQPFFLEVIEFLW